jgi:HEAT repeat protein
VAAALGEAKFDPGLAVLIRYVSEDPDWQVRMAAAQAMGRLSASRSVVGPALVARFGKERDGLVLQAVLRAVGDVGYIDGIPDLIRALEVPSLATAGKAVEALYILTGERFQKKEQWQEWFRTKYPAWRIRQGAPAPSR